LRNAISQITARSRAAAAAAAAAVLQMTQVNGNNSTRRFWARSTLPPDQPEISKLS